MQYSKRGLSALAAGVSALAIAVAPTGVALATNGDQNNNQNMQTYSAHLQPLNNSGVSGYANLHYYPGQSGDTDQLAVNLNAHGTVAGQTHAMHIHGDTNPEVAMCPTNAQDTNNDGFVSVIEGAAAYGPIKLNLTSPQTAFGTPPTPALFTPVAGTPKSADFPMADQAGNVHLTETYHFDGSADAKAAMTTLMPLEHQHIVIHGADAPASVDAAAFAALGAPVTGDMNKVSYDPLLPVACGEIHQSSNQNDNSNNNDNMGNNTPNMPADMPSATPVTSDQNGQTGQTDQNNQAAVDAFHARIAELRTGYDAAHDAAQKQYDMDHQNNAGEARDHYIGAVQSAHDHYVNQFYEARNLFVDQMNRAGQTQLRDQTTSQAESDLHAFSMAFETAKNEFAATH